MKYAPSTKLIALLALLIFPSLDAKTWIPESDEYIVLELKSGENLPSPVAQLKQELERDPDDLNLKIRMIEQYQYWSSKPGYNHLLLYAKQLLSTEVDNHNEKRSFLSKQQTDRIILANANQMQKKHRFSEALHQLDKIRSDSDLYVQAKLMSSRIHQILLQWEESERACRSLLFKASPDIIKLCLIDQKIQKGDSVSLDDIQKLSKQTKTLPDEMLRWLHRIKGDYFRYNNQVENAMKAFQFKLNGAPVSQWIQWADAAIKAEHYPLVFEKLQELDKKIASLDTSLLLRLAFVEKKLTSIRKYNQRVTQQVDLRLLRDDRLHAADIAYYFIHIKPDPSLALQWANINWSSTKEFIDRTLLEQAKQMKEKS